MRLLRLRSETSSVPPPMSYTITVIDCAGERKGQSAQTRSRPCEDGVQAREMRRSIERMFTCGTCDGSSSNLLSQTTMERATHT
eukprot:6096426-Pleurochrysis_carterae.AAC.1